MKEKSDNSSFSYGMLPESFTCYHRIASSENYFLFTKVVAGFFVMLAATISSYLLITMTSFLILSRGPNFTLCSLNHLMILTSYVFMFLSPEITSSIETNTSIKFSCSQRSVKLCFWLKKCFAGIFLA